MGSHTEEKKLTIANLGNSNSFKNNYICKYFLNQGHNVHFICREFPKSGIDGIHYHVIQSKIIRIPNLKLIEIIARTRKSLITVNPDIIHAHNAGLPGIITAACRIHPFIIQCFGGDLFEKKSFVKRICMKFSLAAADGIIVTGEHMVNALSEQFKINPGKVHVIPRGIDLSKFKPQHEKKKLKAQLKLPDGPIILSPRYQLTSIYNIDILFEAFAIVSKISTDSSLIQFYKPGHNTAGYEKLLLMAEHMGISNRVIFLPTVANERMPEFYNIADICISIPSHEGFPVTILEGSACKVPFIVNNLPYTREWFEHMRNGWILNDLSSDSLSNAMLVLLKDKSLRENLAENSYQKVTKGYDYGKCMQKLENLYNELATGKNI